MTIQINWTDDAEKAFEICDDVSDPDWDKIHGAEGGPFPAQKIFAENKKKVMNLSDFRGWIRDTAASALYDHPGVETATVKDKEKQFTQQDLYAIHTALDRLYTNYFNEQARADLLEERIENMSRLDHLKKAILG